MLDTSSREKFHPRQNVLIRAALTGFFFFAFLSICRVTVRDSIRNQEDSIRDESGKLTRARLENRTLIEIISIPFRPRDNRMPINICVYWLIAFREMYVSFRGMCRSPFSSSIFFLPRTNKFFSAVTCSLLSTLRRTGVYIRTLS